MIALLVALLGPRWGRIEDGSMIINIEE